MDFAYPVHLYSRSCIILCFLCYSHLILSTCSLFLQSYSTGAHAELLPPLPPSSRAAHAPHPPHHHHHHHHHRSHLSVCVLPPAMVQTVLLRSVFMASCVVQLYNCQWCCGVCICVMCPKEIVFLLWRCLTMQAYNKGTVWATVPFHIVLYCYLCVIDFTVLYCH